MQRPGTKAYHRTGMRRGTILVLSFLVSSAVLLPAQRGGRAAGGHGSAGKAFSAGISSFPAWPHGNGFHGRPGYGYGRGYGYPYGSWYAPYWGYDYWNAPLTSGWDYTNFPPGNDQGQYAAYPQSQQDTRPATYQAQYSAPFSNPPASPKLIEVPGDGESNAQPQPPAVFVLNNGERIESRHYVLSADSARIVVGRKQKTIPLATIDVDATVAANQQRGIQLTIPNSRDSLFVSF